MLHAPYRGEGRITDSMRDYVVQQIRCKVIPILEEITGEAYDEDRLRKRLALSAEAQDDLVHVLESAKNVPSPIDAYFGDVYDRGFRHNTARPLESLADYCMVVTRISIRLRGSRFWPGTCGSSRTTAFSSSRSRAVILAPRRRRS